MSKFYTVSEAAEKIGVCGETLRRWDNKGQLTAMRKEDNNYRLYSENIIDDLLLPLSSDGDYKHITPNRLYSSIELFAGAGGLALGLEKAGIEHTLLNEVDKYACETLRQNRKEWNVIQEDVSNLCFKKYYKSVDIVTGGFPCQTFSYAGKKLGLEDARGTMFYEFARCVKEVQPKIFLGENVKGLLSHDKGQTIQTMTSILQDLGYKVYTPRVLKAIHYQVPQKRERLFIIGVRDDLNIEFEFPKPFSRLYTLKDALCKGDLYQTDVHESVGQTYPKRKKEILDLVPPGGYWRDLPIDIQKEYMLKSYYLGGGKTGMARRISWDEPSLTLTCAPAQKQTERCHPDHTRPFQVREYARIQTFPDSWDFAGSMSQQYKQIGNAVPVNLAYYIGQAIVSALNSEI